MPLTVQVDPRPYEFASPKTRRFRFRRSEVGKPLERVDFGLPRITRSLERPGRFVKGRLLLAQEYVPSLE